eukprot:17473-Heterococcus_DN1.PRE.2
MKCKYYRVVLSSLCSRSWRQASLFALYSNTVVLSRRPLHVWKSVAPVLWGAAIHTDHAHVQQSAAGVMPVPLRLLSDKERLNVPAKQVACPICCAKLQAVGTSYFLYALEQAAAAETSSSSRQTEHAGEWHFQAEHKLVVCLSKCALSGILLTTSAGSSV